MSLIARIFNAVMAVIMSLTGLVFTGQMPPARLAAPETGPLTRYVNTFVGTGSVPWGTGMTNPGATAPFGTVRMGPDTCWPFGLNLDNVGTGGYWYGKTHTWGFSHNRISGAGLINGGRFRVTPGLDKADPLQRIERPLLFSHGKEVSQPGYYSVWLPEAACLAELTATERTGLHRYTFSSAKDALLFFDATSSLRKEDNENKGPGSIRVVDNKTLEGNYRGEAFFRAEFDAPFEATPWAGGEMLPGETGAEGIDVGVSLNFGNMQDKPITIWVGFSYISIDEAANNLNVESKGLSFEQVYQKTLAQWEARLASVQIETADENIKRVFYTQLYHIYIHPTNVTDASGKYRGFDGSINTADGFVYRGDLSLWDTFRTTTAVYCLIAPDIAHDTVQSLMRQADWHGGFPRWPQTHHEGGSMFGNPAHQALAESYLKGFMSDADANTAVDIMKQTVTNTVPEGKPYRGRDYGGEYRTLGYVPDDIDKISVSRTLEYAWADYSSYLLADALGRSADASLFFDLSENYKNLFDPASKYFRPKSATGGWKLFSPYMTTYYDEVLPFKLARGYSEGSARQYRWHAVQDPQWLVEAIGGPTAFVKELERFMQDASGMRGAIDPGSGWWVGNQHNYHAPYMFNEAGRPDLTQKWVRWTLTDRFADATNGLDGNDDLGALSGWYLLSALGFYPIAGTGDYWLGSPIVDKATLHMGGGKTLTIVAKNQSAKNMYVKSVAFNGAPIEGTRFSHELIKDGGTLEFTMAAEA